MLGSNRRPLVKPNIKGNLESTAIERERYRCSPEEFYLSKKKVKKKQLYSFDINIFLLPFYQKNKKENRSHLSKRCCVTKTHTRVALNNEGNGLRDHIYPK